MQNILHRGAKTTPKIRREIHDSPESLMTLAQRYNLSFKTILKWKHREDFADKPSGAIKPKSVLSDREQGVICEFRRITKLPLDDVYVALKDKIPALTRSNLYRCLRRFGYQKPPKDSKLHPFEQICIDHNIEHRQTQFKHPWTNGLVERMNQTIKKATIQTYFYEGLEELKKHLMLWLLMYNHQKKLKSLDFITPYDKLIEEYEGDPTLFSCSPIHELAGLNT